MPKWGLHKGVYLYEWERTSGELFEVELHYTATEGSPAITGGPPDNWAPEEPAEMEIWDSVIRIRRRDKQGARRPELELEFCERELETNRDSIETSIWEQVDDETKGAREAADEAKYDAWKEEHGPNAREL